MPTKLTVQTGLVITPTANAADATGNWVEPGTSGRVTLRFNNPTGASINVILDDVNSTTPESATAFNPDVTQAVPAGAARYVVLSGERKSRFPSKTTGRISWTYSAGGLVCEVVGV